MSHFYLFLTALLIATQFQAALTSQPDNSGAISVAIESELKMSVDRPELLLRKLIDLDSLFGYPVEYKGKRRYRDEYFDDSLLSLYQQRVSFRLRETWSGSVKVELKHSPRQRGLVCERAEISQKALRDDLHKLRFGDAIKSTGLYRQAVNWSQGRDLAAVLTVISDRHTFLLGNDTIPSALITLDYVTAYGLVGERSITRFYEVELELLSDNERDRDRFWPMVEYFVETIRPCGLRPSDGSKYECGIRSAVIGKRPCLSNHRRPDEL